MTTELDISILRQLTPLECASQLTSLSLAELKAICAYFAVRTAKKADKVELVGLVIAVLHPYAHPDAPTGGATQLALF